MEQLEFTNEKGNVKVSTRNKLRNTILEQLRSPFAMCGDIVHNVNGGFSIPLGVDALSGDTVWAHVELTINAKDPTIDKWTGRKIAATPIEVPNLFEN